MKLAMFVLLMLVGLQAFALEGFNCKEKLPPTPFEMLRYRTVVNIQEVKDVTMAMRKKYPRGSIEAAAVVNVSIGREDENGGHSRLITSYRAFSLTSDVYYQINTLNKNGYKFSTYLDETESNSYLAVKNGSSQSVINLECISK